MKKSEQKELTKKQITEIKMAIVNSTPICEISKTFSASPRDIMRIRSQILHDLIYQYNVEIDIIDDNDEEDLLDNFTAECVNNVTDETW